MTQEEIINEYKEKMCPYCKGQCDKGITIVGNEYTIYAKCVDYKPKDIIKKNKLIENWQIKD